MAGWQSSTRWQQLPRGHDHESYHSAPGRSGNRGDGGRARGGAGRRRGGADQPLRAGHGGAGGRLGRRHRQLRDRLGPVGRPRSAADQQTLIAILPYIKLNATGIDGKPTITFSRANLQVVDGSGYTSRINGTGNVVIGYDEGGGTQTGSHNLILGTGQTDTSSGGIIGGHDNIAGGQDVLLGGAHNSATATATSVTGGASNTAAMAESSITGGLGNSTFASGELSSISGGDGNQAGGYASSVTGGYQNIAGSEYATVSGGAANVAGDPASSVSGGCANFAGGSGGTTAGDCPFASVNGVDSVSGGEGNRGWGRGASVLGGCNNTAGNSGAFNTAGCPSSGDQTVLGGQQNYAPATDGIVAGVPAEPGHGRHLVGARRR